MAEAIFTPGPWKTGNCDGCIIWAGGFRSTAWREFEAGPEAVCIGNAMMPGWAHSHPPENDEDGGFARRERWNEECKANALLMAAAPDLYAALLNIAEGNLGDAPWQAGHARIREVANAALAKARGEEECPSTSLRTSG